MQIIVSRVRNMLIRMNFMLTVFVVKTVSMSLITVSSGNTVSGIVKSFVLQDFFLVLTMLTAVIDPCVSVWCMSLAGKAACKRRRARDEDGSTSLQPAIGGLVLLDFSALSVVWAVESVAVTAAALFGIGLGWNFSYVAATAELADRTVPVERGKILGFTDLCSGLLGATLALLGGLLLSAVGLAGLGVVGLAVAVAPTLWILQIVSKHFEYRE